MSTQTYDGFEDHVDLDLIDNASPAEATSSTRLASASTPRFISALACLGAAYALSWAEFALALMAGLPGDAASHPVAASVVSKLLVALLYGCVAARLQWARWVTVALGFVSVAFVAPTLALQWHVFPAAAVVSGVGVVCKLAASLFLMAPMEKRLS
jgi:hypothetical protein